MYRGNTKGWFKHLDFMILDLLCLQVSFLAAYWIRRLGNNPYADVNYRSIALLVEVFDVLVLLMYGTLSDVLKRRKYAEFAKTVKHTIWLMALTMIYLFAAKSGETYSRLMVFMMFVIYFILAFCVRTLWKVYLNQRTDLSSARTMLVITTRDRAEETAENLAKKEFGNVRVVGLCLMDEGRGKEAAGEKTGNAADAGAGNGEEAGGAGDGGCEEVAGIPIVCSIDTAEEYICREWVDEVFIRYPHQMQIDWKKIRKLSESGVTIHLKLEDGYESFGHRQIIETLGGYTVMTATMNTMSHRQAFLKRCMDIAGGLVGCILTGIIFLFVAPAIKRASPGPVFFQQTRIGRNGKKFQMYKFRSMYLDAEERKAELYEQNRVEDGMMFKMDFDPRVIGNKILPDGTKKTGIGEFIRRTSLDEFPQFYNVLRGDMSLVGTRPPTLDEWEKYELHHRARLAIKPGITGMWQVSGRSDIQDFEEVVRLDVQYINEWSLGLDIKILLKTVKNVFTGEGAL